MKQRIKVKWEEMLPGDKVLLSDAVNATADVEREVELSSKDWHPMVPKIIDVVCALDPENGSGVIGSNDHSHDPSTGECYWAYNVGPNLANLFTEEPKPAIITRDMLRELTRATITRANAFPTLSPDTTIMAAFERLLDTAGVEVTP